MSKNTKKKPRTFDPRFPIALYFLLYTQLTSEQIISLSPCSTAHPKNDGSIAAQLIVLVVR